MHELIPLEEIGAPDRAGGKGASLHWLRRNGYRIPPTWVAPPGFKPDVRTLDPTQTYAVRSSANVEDGRVASYAGQFLTVLDVSSHEGIAESIESVRASAVSTVLESYTTRMHEHHRISMAVLVQQMITPVVSGVVFTRNPITGLNEVVLEAVAGRGDQLVGEGATPQRWVRHWGSWTTQPEADPVLPDAAAVEIATESSAIARKYGRPVDLEWVWDGSQVWWVQLRPITGVADVAVYSNRISKEVMPGLIKPLVWSINVPVVNRAWIQLFTEAIGRNDLQPENLAKSFAYRSYFNMAAIGDIFELMGMPRDSLELLLGLPEGPDKPSFKPSAATIRKMPRLLAFALRKSRYGKGSDKLIGGLRSAYAAYDKDLEELADEALLADVAALMELGSRAAYANIVVPLLANIYSSLLRKGLARRGIDEATIEIDDDPTAHELDPNPSLDHLGEVIAASGVDSPQAEAALADFLGRFGHFSDSGNDFSVAPWREQPELVMDMAASRGAATRGESRRSWADIEPDLGALGRLTFGPLRKRSARYEKRREQISSLYTYGYGLFRNYFLELGRRLVDRGLLGRPEDVMFLTRDEVETLLSGALEGPVAAARVAAHRAELERVADLVMPETIYGDDFIAAVARDPAATLHGVATSRGHHRGPVKVVSGIGDFAKVDEGDVLAIPFSDVGWTPLFAKAGAVIAESGGMLSHSSIVAREYGIPCVVSVTGATRLEDGAMVTVDGYRGEIVRD